MKNYDVYNKNKEYFSIFGEIASGEVIEKKSKFYSYLFRIHNEKEAIFYINQIKKENKEARHVVYIYSILGENGVNQIRFSDDGEPKGTGTKAIYELLTKEAITNICIVIVRYFGGILLGAGPLSRAYLNTAREALDQCQKKEILHYISYQCVISYPKYQIIKPLLEQLILEEKVRVLHTQFHQKIELLLEIQDNSFEEIVNFLK